MTESLFGVDTTNNMPVYLCDPKREEMGYFGVRPWIFKGQPRDAKVTVDMKGRDAKGAF